ncbi:MAG: DUF2723 domain-containing protein [Planctomycetes bacterium]|nr:DUF2723 domain-containing protein [Planctomycetota bacterium]
MEDRILAQADRIQGSGYRCGQVLASAVAGNKLMRMGMRFKIIAITFAVSLTVYVLTIGGFVYWQDSGMYLAAVKELGLTPATGFPLYIILAKLTTVIFSFLDFTITVHLFSAICGAAANAVIALTTYELFVYGAPFFGSAQKTHDQKSDLWAAICSVFGGLLFGFGFYTWSQAVNAEIYSMQALLSVLVLYFLMKLARFGPLELILTKEQMKLLFIIAAVWGLALGNHLMMALPFAGMFVYCLLINPHRKSCAKTLGIFCAVAFASFLLPYLYLFVPSKENYFYFGDLSSFSGILQYITGFQWTGRGGWFSFPLDRLADYPRIFYEQYMIGGLLCVGAGGVLFFKNYRKLFWALIVFCSLSLFGSWCYLHGGEYDMWIIPLFAALSFFSAYFIYVVRMRALSGLFAFAAVGNSIFVNYHIIDRSKYTYAQELGSNVLKNLDLNSILILSGDSHISTAFYMQSVKNFRKDVTVVVRDYLRVNWYLEQLQLVHKLLLPPQIFVPPGVDEAEAVTAELIRYNHATRHIFCIKRPDLLVDGVFAVPSGAFLKIEKKQQVELRYWEYKFSTADLSELKKSERKLAPKYTYYGDGSFDIQRRTYIETLIEFKAQSLLTLADWYFFMAQGSEKAQKKEDSLEFYKKAQGLYKRAVEMVPDGKNLNLMFAAATVSYKTGDYDSAMKYIDKYSELRGQQSPQEQLMSRPNLGQLFVILSEIHRSKGETFIAQIYQDKAKQFISNIPEVKTPVKEQGSK